MKGAAKGAGKGSKGAAAPQWGKGAVAQKSSKGATAPWGKAAVAQPAAASGTRAKIQPQRATGKITAWKGNFGWVQPDQPIKHPKASGNGGKIYLGHEDVEAEISGVGAAVSFFVYADVKGLGAMNCIPSKGNVAVKTVPKPAFGALSQKAGQKGAATKGAGKGAKPAVQKPAVKKMQGPPAEREPPNKEERTSISADVLSGTVTRWHGEVGFIKPDEPLDEAVAEGRKQVFAHITDVEGEEPLAGAQVIFQLYSDAKGLGAEMIQVTTQGDGSKQPGANDGRKKNDKKKAGNAPRGEPREKGPSGPDLPRERVSDDFITGEVIDWRSKGTFGWIQPTEAIDRPEAKKHRGRVYVHVQDLQGVEELEKGSTVQFQLFVDASGLGAEEVSVI